MLVLQLGWWIKTVTVTAENSDLFWASANLFLANALENWNVDLGKINLE